MGFVVFLALIIDWFIGVKFGGAAGAIAAVVSLGLLCGIFWLREKLKI